MNPPFEVDHIGIAVKSIDKAFEFYKALGWSTLKVEEVPSEKVRVGFIEFGNQVHIELLEATSEDSPIAKFIAKRGEGIHHICIKTQNISDNLEVLKNKGYRLINEQAKAGAKNCMVAFVHPASANGVLLEFSESQGGDYGA